MDITIDIDGYKLNVRAAIIIKHENKILVHRNIKENHYALLGGRVEIGEDSETTIKREIFEEMGKEIEITGYVTTIENFFEMKGSKFHEIMFIYKGEFRDDKDKKIMQTIKNIEGKEYLQYEWLDLDNIEKYPLKPEVIKKLLKEEGAPAKRPAKRKAD